MNEKDKEVLEDLKKRTETFFKENKDKSCTKIYKYTLVPYRKENLYIFATSKTEDFHCFVITFDVFLFGVTIFDRRGKDLEKLFKAALEFSDERNKLLGKWKTESEAKAKKLKHEEGNYNWNDLEYMRDETRLLSRKKFTHHEFIPKYAEISEIEEFLEHADGIDYFSLTYGRDHLLNLVIDTDRSIIGAIGTYKNTFLFEDYGFSLEHLLEDSKARFNEHAKLIFEANTLDISGEIIK